MSTPLHDGFYFPAEWDEHRGTLIAYPCRPDAYGGHIAAAQKSHIAVANAIAEFEKVIMITRPQDERVAKKSLNGEVEVLPLPIDDAWMRDSGPTFLRHPNGDSAGVDWRFNAWGSKYAPYDKDNAVAEQILRHLNIRRYAAPLVLEGGSIHTNGGADARQYGAQQNRALLTTRQCLLNRNRNPHLTQPQIEQTLRDYLAVSDIIWLSGDDRDDETDGHIDNIACFTSPTQALLMYDDSNPQHRDNDRLLRQARVGGKPIDITRVPQPTVTENGVDLLASYINFSFANGAIIMPKFGKAEDPVARGILQCFFPDRKIIQLDATAIARGGGGIHCITQNF